MANQKAPYLYENQKKRLMEKKRKCLYIGQFSTVEQHYHYTIKEILTVKKYIKKFELYLI